MTMSTGTPRRSSSGTTAAALPTTPDGQRPARRAWPPAPARRASSRGSATRVEVAGARPGAPGASGSTSTIRQTPPFMVTASGCAPPIPPQPAVSVSVPARRAAEALGGHRRERLVGALQDALGADVDPRAGGHLAVHGQAERLQPAELRPGGPVADQVGVGDQYPGRPLVGPEHADRPARLHQHRLVVGERGAGCAPGRGRTASPARPCRCRRRPPGPRGARPPPGRGCSAASAARPPAASPARCGWYLVGHGSRLLLSGLRWVGGAGGCGRGGRYAPVGGVVGGQWRAGR